MWKNCELVKKITCLPSIEVSSPCEASRCPKKRIVGGGGVALGDRCPGHGGAHLELKGFPVYFIFLLVRLVRLLGWRTCHIWNNCSSSSRPPRRLSTSYFRYMCDGYVCPCGNAHIWMIWQVWHLSNLSHVPHSLQQMWKRWLWQINMLHAYLANPVLVVIVKIPFGRKTFPVQSLPHCHNMRCAKIL